MGDLALLRIVGEACLVLERIDRASVQPLIGASGCVWVDLSMGVICGGMRL